MRRFLITIVMLVVGGLFVFGWVIGGQHNKRESLCNADRSACVTLIRKVRKTGLDNAIGYDLAFGGTFIGRYFAPQASISFYEDYPVRAAWTSMDVLRIEPLEFAPKIVGEIPEGINLEMVYTP